jgi:hypothetical protein
MIQIINFNKLIIWTDPINILLKRLEKDLKKLI